MKIVAHCMHSKCDWKREYPVTPRTVILMRWWLTRMFDLHYAKHAWEARKG